MDVPTELDQAVLNILTNHPEGLDAYYFIKKLNSAQCEGFLQVDFGESLALFQLNFLLFHTLYRLRDLLWREKTGHLVISPLHIALQPYQAGEASLTAHDPLRQYYLNLDNLTKTTKGQVNELLNVFWKKFYAREERQTALAVLELHDPVDHEIIKQQYRRLVMRYHPDRGGDKERLQQLNEAMNILKQCHN